MQRLVRDLNTLYRAEPALHALDADPNGFQWIEADDAARSVFAWIRRSGGDEPDVAVICNFTPVERSAYTVGLPFAGRWREALCTDAEVYGGKGRGNMGGVTATDTPSHGQPASAEVYLPPLSVVYLVRD
jgi:1,4-alpha-glucan branching enzyme